MPRFRHALSATAPLGPRGWLSRALLPCTFLLALSAICALAQPATAAESQREIRRSFPDRPGTFVELENLAGEMTIEGGASEIEILATVRARDDSEADARQL